MSRTDCGISAGVSASRTTSRSNAPISDRCLAISRRKKGLPSVSHSSSATITDSRSENGRPAVSSSRAMTAWCSSPRSVRRRQSISRVRDGRAAENSLRSGPTSRYMATTRSGVKRLARIRYGSRKRDGWSAHCRSSRTRSTGCRAATRRIHVSSDSKSRKRSASAAAWAGAVEAPTRCAGSGHSRAISSARPSKSRRSTASGEARA